MRNVCDIPTDNTSWTDISRESPDRVYRISAVKGIQTLWQKHIHPMYYGGHQIKRIALDTRLAREWLDLAGYDTFALNMASK